MNRKELGCAALGAVLGVAGCSQPTRSLLVPQASAQIDPNSAVYPGIDVKQSELHLWVPHAGGAGKITTLEFIGKQDEWTMHVSNPRCITASFYPYSSTVLLMITPIGIGLSYVQLRRNNAPDEARIIVRVSSVTVHGGG